MNNNRVCRNPAFEMALARLTHPFSLAAVALLLLNDTLLRRFWPGWWTGKLSDLAWLLFVPFFIAAGLALLLPWTGGTSNEERRSRRLMQTAFLGTGAAFILVKTLPAANELAMRIGSFLLPGRPALAFDPSDCLALIGLGLSACWWYATPHFNAPRLTLRRAAALPLVALLLLADAAAPDLGISCFSVAPGQIRARAGYQSYRSTDGGMTWHSDTPGTEINCATAAGTVEPDPDGWRTVPGPQPGELFRYRAGDAILRSTDGGKTWQGYTPQAVTEAAQIYLVRSHSGNAIYSAGPLDAAADPQSGNMLFAMGLQGVLLRSPSGEWVWSMSSDYRQPNAFPTTDAWVVLLGGMAVLAAALALLIFSVLALRWTFHWVRLVLWVLALLAWLGVDVLFPPAISSGYTATAAGFGLLALVILILPLAIEQAARLTRRAPRAIPRLIGVGLVGGLLYFIPYSLWLYNRLPSFSTTTLVSLILAAVVLIAGLIIARRVPRHLSTPLSLLLAALLSLTILSGCQFTGQPAGLVTQAAHLPAPSLPAAPPAAASTPAPTDTAAGHQVQASHRAGQTFLTWTERSDLHGEHYRIYRAPQPLDAAGLKQAKLLAEVGENSARFYGNRFIEDSIWKTRYADNLIIEENAPPLPAGTGLLVWTLAPEDFGGQSAGAAYYTITVIPADGIETFSAAYTLGPLDESVSDPLPVEITHSPDTVTEPDSHVYIQFMDLRRWNATYHAPNSTNQFFGLDPQAPDVKAALAYAYDYQVYTPDPELCGGQLPDRLPVMLFLHGARTNRYGSVGKNPYPHCAYSIFPIDQSDTWYFGFARDHDYRKGGSVQAGDVIENFTERRVLRMVYDLMRSHPGPDVDPQRVYVFGHSMGGSGTLAFIQRYPNVFAAGYSGQPISNYRTAGVTKANWPELVAVKWGASDLNLPIHMEAPGGWAEPLQKYNGVGVWDWQNYQANFTRAGIPGRAADEMAPFGVDHGIVDDVILWPSQGQVFYPLLNTVGRTWGGAVTQTSHEWSDFVALPPSLGKLDGHPFWNLQVIRDESVPGLSRLSSSNPNPPTAPAVYNATLKWSSSWDPWDKAPIDQPDLWQMSFCAVKPGSMDCGTGAQVTVDITPRRLQQFKVQPGAQYDWENRQIAGNRQIARGTVTADANGLITIPDFIVTPRGSRLIVRPHTP